MTYFSFFISSNMQQTLSRQILAFSLALLLFSCRNQQDQAFRFNLQPGITYRFALAWDMTRELAGEQSVLSFGTSYAIQVKHKEKDAFTLTITYDNLRVKMHMMGVEADVDTRQPFLDSTVDHLEIPEMISRMFYGLKGRSFTLQINREGRVLQVTGLQELEKEIVTSMGMPPEFLEAGQLLFRGQVNEELLREQFERIFHIYPDREIVLGDSWQLPMESSGIRYQARFKVKELDEHFAGLEMDAAIQSSGGEEPGEMKGRQEATLKVDRGSGMVLEGSYGQESTSVNGTDTMILRSSGKLTGALN